MHNIFLAEHYRASFDEIFDDGKVPSEPSFYVNVPSRIDPSAAPSGGDTLVVLVPCGPIASKDAPEGYQDQVSFAQIKAKVRSQVLATLHARTGRDLAPLIREEHVLDPWDWRQRFGLWSGSILGLSHCISQVLWFRPSNQYVVAGVAEAFKAYTWAQHAHSRVFRCPHCLSSPTDTRHSKICFSSAPAPCPARACPSYAPARPS